MPPAAPPCAAAAPGGIATNGTVRMVVSAPSNPGEPGEVSAGGAVSKACETLAGRLRKHAAHLLQTSPEAIELRDGSAFAGAASVSYRDIARASNPFGSRKLGSEFVGDDAGLGDRQGSDHDNILPWHARPLIGRGAG